MKRFFSNLGLGFLFAFGIMSLPLMVMIEESTFQIFYPVFFEAFTALVFCGTISLCIADLFKE